MRSRPNAASRRAVATNDGGVANSSREETDSNGKDKPKKFKRPPVASFKLPPPPKLASLSVRNNGAAKNDATSVPESDTTEKDHIVSGSETINSIASPSSIPAMPPVPAVPIPPPPSSTSAVYQRANRSKQTSDADKKTVETSTQVVNTSGTSKNGTSYSSDSYSNTYPAQQYQSSNQSRISHPYQPSSWYANARSTKRRNQILQYVIGSIVTIVWFIFLWLAYKETQQNAPKKKHHKNYHHHDQPYYFHPMMGMVDSPMEFGTKESSSKNKRSYRQLEQEDSSSRKGREEEQTTGDMHDLFSTVPVTTLSNDRLLPYVGFGVASQSVEHKQIPIIVSTLLQYASSETEGGGGIAMVDAVIDEDRKIENSGGSLQYSISNKIVEKYEQEEEKLESSMAKTVVTLVGRAIGFFGKEHNKLHSSSGGVAQSAKSGSKDKDVEYDYENRLEVHLLVGLSGSDLGLDNTLTALHDIMAELDGLVPPFPKDALHSDMSEWKTEPTSISGSDHHVDVRLHVLLRLNHCHNKAFKVAPCSADEATNKELLERWIGSYAILERLYTAKIIHGIGLDGIHGEDIQYLLSKCKIKPQLYRGDVSQALDIFGRRMGNFKQEHIAAILHENNITFLASNVAGHILERQKMAPNAYALLQNLGGVLYRAHNEMLAAQGGMSLDSTGQKGEGEYYTVPRLVLSYLVRHKVCVLPHAYKAEHLADDAPESVGGLANFLTERRLAEIGAALKALLSDEDLPAEHGLGMEGEMGVAAVFHNTAEEEVHLFPVDESNSVGQALKSGGSVVIIAKTGDIFAAYGGDGAKQHEYTVNAESGGANDFTIRTHRQMKIKL